MAIFQLIDRGDSWLELRMDTPNSKANIFTREALDEFSHVVEDLENRTEIKGVVVTSEKPGIFIAGADVNLIKALNTFEEAVKGCSTGQQIINRFANLPFETVAAINGACLGGGFELALACRKRVASSAKSVKIGLPEVQLGVLPGFGGSIRLPRLLTLPTALDLILSGKQVDGKRALRMSITSAMLPEQDFNERAMKWAKKNAGKAAKRPRGGLMNFFFSLPFGRAFVLSQARKNVQKLTKGHYPAPFKILDLLGKTLGKSNMEWCLDQEAKHFAALAITPISKRLIELFQLSESVKKHSGVVGDDITAQKVQRVAVLGAGIMGGGIAHAFAKVGLPVRMKDLTNEAIALGYKQAASVFSKGVKKRRMTPREFTQKIGLISGTLEYTGFGSVDVVVEAVVENMQIKQSVLKETEKNTHEDCIFASNTSSLSITELQSVSSRPKNVAGLHFFNPVDRMPLVEVIAGAQTSKETVATLFELVKKMKKTPVVVQDCAGFLVNRLLVPYMNEAVYLLEEGVPIERIDRVMLQFGMPMGPLRLADEVGLDTASKVGAILHDAYGKRAKPAELTAKVAESGRYGRKNGKGFYRWENNKAVGPDDGIYEFVNGGAKTSASLSDQELIERMVYPMINEAALALEEGVVTDPGAVDLAMIFGTGFPPFRGGPLRHADNVGIENIRTKLDRMYQAGVGARLEPNRALSGYVDRGKFYQ